MATEPPPNSPTELARLRTTLAAANRRIEQLEAETWRLRAENARLQTGDGSPYEALIQAERNRIAQEIHDGVAQNLALLLLKVEIMSRLVDIDPQRLKPELDRVGQILESTVQQLRHLVSTMRSARPATPTKADHG